MLVCGRKCGGFAGCNAVGRAGNLTTSEAIFVLMHLALGRITQVGYLNIPRSEQNKAPIKLRVSAHRTRHCALYQSNNYHHHQLAPHIYHRLSAPETALGAGGVETAVPRPLTHKKFLIYVTIRMI